MRDLHATTRDLHARNLSYESQSLQQQNPIFQAIEPGYQPKSLGIAIQLAGWQDESRTEVLHFRLVEAGLALKAQHSGYPQTTKRRDQRRRQEAKRLVPFLACERACVRRSLKGRLLKQNFLPPFAASQKGCTGLRGGAQIFAPARKTGRTEATFRGKTFTRPTRELPRSLRPARDGSWCKRRRSPPLGF